jgi:hypothetical protein
VSSAPDELQENLVLLWGSPIVQATSVPPVVILQAPVGGRHAPASNLNTPHITNCTCRWSIILQAPVGGRHAPSSKGTTAYHTNRTCRWTKQKKAVGSCAWQPTAILQRHP